MASNANDYTIYTVYHINQDGTLIGKLDETDGRAACVIESAHIVQAMLRTDRIKLAFDQMTADHAAHFKATWYLTEGQGEPQERKDKVALEFLKFFSVFHQFPALCLSDRLRHLSVTGALRRNMWQDVFQLFAHRIVLNGVVSRKLTRFRCRLAS